MIDVGTVLNLSKSLRLWNKIKFHFVIKSLMMECSWTRICNWADTRSFCGCYKKFSSCLLNVSCPITKQTMDHPKKQNPDHSQLAQQSSPNHHHLISLSPLNNHLHRTLRSLAFFISSTARPGLHKPETTCGQAVWKVGLPWFNGLKKCYMFFGEISDCLMGCIEILYLLVTIKFQWKQPWISIIVAMMQAQSSK